MASPIILAATGSRRFFSELVASFQANGAEANLIQLETPARLSDFRQNDAVVAVIADTASWPFAEILPQVRQAFDVCPVYAVFETLDEEAISEAVRLGAFSFALRSGFAGLTDSIRKNCLARKPWVPVKARQSSAQILHALLEESTDSIWVKDRQGEYLLINPAGARFLGKSIKEVVGKTDYEVFPEETADKVRASDRQVMRDGVTQTVEDLILTLDGTARTFQAVKGVFRDEHGEIQGVIGTVRDITDRRRAEEELKYYAARLERSNKDLEQFAFIASHDLQAPLRKIRIFSEILQELVGEDGKDTGLRLQRSVIKMQQLITDLLALSRVNRKGNPFQEVSLDKVIAEAMEDLELGIRETQATVTVEAMGSVYGDPGQLEQLFQNLIGNSLKYRKPDIAPEIKIRGELLMNGFYQIMVQDQGIGFKEQYLERIFRPFERLHGEATYPGTGMGLAICQKIVERHGGQITATSREGEGSVFIIYLPAHADMPQRVSGDFIVESAAPGEPARLPLAGNA